MRPGSPARFDRVDFISGGPRRALPRRQGVIPPVDLSALQELAA